jgi:hypothetical protein
VAAAKPKKKSSPIDIHLRKSVSPEKSKRQDTVKTLVHQEVAVEDIVDLIIAGGFHKPSTPIDPTDPKATARFRQSVRRLVYYDIKDLVSAMSAEDAARKPLFKAMYEQQQIEMYRSAKKVWDGQTGKNLVGRALNPIIVARAAELMMQASQNLAAVRGIDIKPKQRVEVDVGERLAKASRARVGEFWKDYRKANPSIPNKETERPVINVTPRAPQAAIAASSADDTDDYN